MNSGYVHVYAPPGIARFNCYVAEHVAICERAMGHSMPKGAEVHHVDGNKANNHPSNLVVCESHAYHLLLHARAKALTACGNPSWRRCLYCKGWDNPACLQFNASNRHYFHKTCNATWHREHQRRLRAKGIKRRR